MVPSYGTFQSAARLIVGKIIKSTQPIPVRNENCGVHRQRGIQVPLSEILFRNIWRDQNERGTRFQADGNRFDAIPI